MTEVANDKKNLVNVPDRVRLRAWPKMLFFWPSALAALAAGIGTSLSPEMSQRWEFWGTLFFVIFALNLLIITFEFPRSTSLTLVLVIVALAFAFVEINRRYNIIVPLQEFIERLRLAATPDFYFAIFTVYVILLISMFINTRFSYWEISNNEIVHFKGMMQDVERFDTDGLHYQKEITDFFEFVIGGSGRLILDAPAFDNPIILDNVLRINYKANVLDHILEYKQVVVSNSSNQAPVAPQPEAALVERSS